ncbi:MAG: carbon-nitrogen hydrolase family protein [Coriobacteriales bacterium]|jgi:predicted amidohydrolase
MRIALAQMRMSTDANENLAATLEALDEAAAGGADLALFPEVQLSPFFAQYEASDPRALDAASYLVNLDGPEVGAIRESCARLGVWASPNVYLRGPEGRGYDASLLIDDHGELVGEPATMVHVAQLPLFYERDYYEPSREGFRTYETPWGRLGIVICFDRHLPESVRTCALRGASLVLVPTANVEGEPLELFEWEMRVQAFQDGCFVAMCNRTGTEGEVTFAGGSLVTDPDGNLVVRAGAGRETLFADVDLSWAVETRRRRPYLSLRRPETYER